MDYFLKTARLGFRCWSHSDLPLASALWSDPRVSEFIGGPFAPDAIRSRLDREIMQMHECGMQMWPIFLLDGNTHVGCAGLRPYKTEPSIPELGYHLHPAYWGRGFAQEAAKGVISYAFTVLNASALFAGHHPENLESCRVLLKIGFSYTGEAFYQPSGMVEPTYLLPRAAWSALP